MYTDMSANYTLLVQRSKTVSWIWQIRNRSRADQLQSKLNDGSMVLALDAQGFATISHNPVVANGGNAAALKNTVDEGTDLLRNIERLEFADLSVDISGRARFSRTTAHRRLTINDPHPRDPTGAPAVGDTLTAVSTLTATPGGASPAQSPISGSIRIWYAASGSTLRGHRARGGRRRASIRAKGLFQGDSIRLKATYVDGNGFTETVFSEPLAAGALLLADPAKTRARPPGSASWISCADTTAYQGEDVNIFIPRAEQVRRRPHGQRGADLQGSDHRCGRRGA